MRIVIPACDPVPQLENDQHVSTTQCFHVAVGHWFQQPDPTHPFVRPLLLAGWPDALHDDRLAGQQWLYRPGWPVQYAHPDADGASHLGHCSRATAAGSL